MDIQALKQFILETFPGSRSIEANGDLFFLYGTGEKFPFATIVTKDDDYDNVSQLNREGIFRLNIGVSKATFKSLFGELSSKPGIGGFKECGLDFTVTDELLPHPVYGSMYWISVLNPGDKTIPLLEQYLTEAYDIAVRK